MGLVPYNKTILWKVQTWFFREPKRIRFLAACLQYVGLLGGFLSVGFASQGSEAQRWSRVCSIVLVTFSSFLSLCADVINASPFQLVGQPIFLIGFILLCFTFGLIPPNQDLSIAILGTVSVCLILAGCTLFAKENFEAMRRPIFGVQNYPFYSVVLFGVGVLILLTSVIAVYPSIPIGVIPSTQLSILGSGVLIIASVFLWAGGCILLVDYTNAILHRYHSTALLMKNLTKAKIFFLSSAVGSLGGISNFVLLLFVPSSSLLFWGVFAGTLLQAFARFTQAVVFLGTGDFLFVICSFLLGIGDCCFASFCIVILQGSNTIQATNLVIASGSLNLVSGLFLFLRQVRLSFASFLVAAGNFFGAGEICIVVASSFMVAFSSFSATSFLLVLWSIYTTQAFLFSWMHSSNCKDVAEALNFEGPEAEPWKADTSIPSELTSDTAWLHETEIEETDVVIVGGGPTGLTLANEMGIRGIRCILIDQKAHVVPDSRFFLCHGTTMEGMVRLGLANEYIERGQSVTFGNGNCLCSGLAHPDARIFTHSQGYPRELHQRLGNEGSRLETSRTNNCLWNYQSCQRVMQGVQEACLLEKAQSYPSVSVRFSTSCLDLKLSKDLSSCSVLVAGTHQKLLRSKFVVGCDGAYSTISYLTQTKFDGFTQVASARSTYFYAPRLVEAIRGKLIEAHQYHVVRKGVGVGYLAQRDAKRGLWTLVLVAMYDGRSPAGLKPDEVPGVVQAMIGPGIDFEIITDGRWRWNFLVARTLKKGPVFLAGDACHSWPPFAGNGGNTGYTDACNLAWKLSAAIKGWCGPELLNSYDQERRDQGLRLAMAVGPMTPNPARALLGGLLLYVPFFSIIARCHWHFGLSGEHFGNNWSTGGMQMGLRYDFSPVVVDGNRPTAPPEDPTCVYVPKVTTGGRVLHVELSTSASIHHFVAMDGYTLILTSCGYENRARDIVHCFEKIGAPIVFHDLVDELQNCRRGRRNEYAASLWRRAKLVICRPDLFVAWVLGDEISWSLERGVKIVETVCGFGASSDQLRIADSMTRWLTWRMVESMKPMRHLFKKGVFVVNERKQRTDAQGLDNVKGNVVSLNADGNSELYLKGESHVVQKDKSELRCAQCEEGISQQEGEICWMNDKAIHPQCLVLYRKNVGNTGKICAYCSGYLNKGEGRFLNNCYVHSKCLEDFTNDCKEEAGSQVPEMQMF